MRYTITLALASLMATPAFAAPPQVVTDLPPVHSLVAMVTGDLASPILLLEPGADPHDFQLRPSQAAAVAAAGLVVWMGPGMSPWLDRALRGLGDGSVSLDLLESAGTALREAGDAHASDDGHAHDHDHAHDHGTHDPHAWLDPANARLWLSTIAGALAAADPANAETYRANAANGADTIAALDARLAARLGPVTNRPFVTTHDALGYFIAHYGLNSLGAIAASDATAPSAARLRALEEASAGQPGCIFPEPNHDPALAVQLAEATGLRLGGPLDPEGVTLPPGPALYAALMTGLADTLADCLLAR